jgi:threonine/homoserine/homoserine lactone efflux protein
MDLELWLAFVGAYTVNSIIPGPSVLVVIGQAPTRGASAALFCIPGDVLGGIFPAPKPG